MILCRSHPLVKTQEGAKNHCARRCTGSSQVKDCLDLPRSLRLTLIYISIIYSYTAPDLTSAKMKSINVTLTALALGTSFCLKQSPLTIH